MNLLAVIIIKQVNLKQHLSWQKEAIELKLRANPTLFNSSLCVFRQICLHGKEKLLMDLVWFMFLVSYIISMSAYFSNFLTLV